MKNKTCRECRYHIGMSCHLPQGTIIMLPEKEACRHFIPKPKLTVFDHITESVEALAEKFVYHIYLTDCLQRKRSYWRSTFFPRNNFSTKEKAIAATIEELKKEWSNE